MKLISTRQPGAFGRGRARARPAEGRARDQRTQQPRRAGDARQHEPSASPTPKRCATRCPGDAIDQRPPATPQRIERSRMSERRRDRHRTPDRHPHHRHRARGQELGRRAGADDRHFRAARARAAPATRSCPICTTRVPAELLREPLISGAVQVLAPALHKFLIPCAPVEPSTEFDRMQQRVVVGALRDDDRAVGLVVTIEDVTARLERERQLARQLRDGDAADRVAGRPPAGRARTDRRPRSDRNRRWSDEDWQVRRTRGACARGAGAMRRWSTPSIAALRDGHRNFSLLSSALQLLSLTGVDVTEALISLMGHPDADVRDPGGARARHAATAGSDRGADRRARRPGRQRPVSCDRGDRQAGAAGRDRSAGRHRGVGRFLPGVPRDRGAGPDRRSAGRAAPRRPARRRAARGCRGRGARTHRRRRRGRPARRRAQFADLRRLNRSSTRWRAFISGISDCSPAPRRSRTASAGRSPRRRRPGSFTRCRARPETR